MSSDLPVEFLQTKDERGIIKERLIRSIKNSHSLRAAVAYFNLNHTELDGLGELLSQPDSFICVDIGLPTELLQLKKLDELCKNVHLFHHSDGFFGCLHAKLLLFTLKEENIAEIWIGSQNFTLAAINGPNYESTCVIKTSVNSQQYKDVEKYLDFIRGKCAPLKSLSNQKLSEIQRNHSVQQLKELTEATATDNTKNQGKQKPSVRTLAIMTNTPIVENVVIEVFSSHSNDNQKNSSDIPALRKLINDSKPKNIKISTQETIVYDAKVIGAPSFYTLTSRDGSQSAGALKKENTINKIQGYVIRIGSLPPVYFQHTDKLKAKIDNWLNTQSGSVVNFVLKVEKRQNSNELFASLGSNDNLTQLYSYYESVLNGEQPICNLSSHDEPIIQVI